MDLIKTFEETIGGPWETAGNDVQYRIIVDGEMAVIVFQGTVSKEDWELNFNCVVVPYKNMLHTWHVHRGFITGYKSVRDDILARIKDKKFVFIMGYSLGGAYATLCHEDIVFHYPGMDIGTITFGAPKVFWMPPSFLRARCEAILHVRNVGDIVPFLPPLWFGFSHVGTAKVIGSVWNAMKHTFPIKRWDELPGAKMHLVGSYRDVLLAENRRNGAN